MLRKIIQHVIMLIVCVSVGEIGAGVQAQILNPSYSFLGEQDAGRIGYYLAAAGDVNNDGLGDFLIGSYHTSLHGWNSGAVFLLLGREEVDWQLNSILNEEADAVFRGKRAYEMVGYNMAGEGDFNGDGYDDLLIGAPGNWKTYPPIPGYLYIVFGKANPDWGFDCIMMDEADVTIVGEDDFDQFGYASCFVDDLDDDGYDDVLVTAPYRNQGNEWAGKAYVIRGRPELATGSYPILDLAAASFIYPRYQGTVGSAVAGIDDVNQDGIPDFVISAKGIGTSFLMLGRESIDWGYDCDLAAADCIFYPEHRNDDGGWQVKSAGDINADGYPDFLISGLEIHFEAGKVYAIFGRRDWPVEGINLSKADASFIGEGSYDQAGVSVNGLGDFTGDGIDDFIIGARYHVHSGAGTRGYHRGKAYLIEGKRSGWSRDVPLKEIDYYFNGEDSVSCAGWGVSTTGDLNGDSRPDLIISAPFNDDSREAGYYVGEVYVILGDYPVKTISGRLVYHANSDPIQDAEVGLSGDASRMIRTRSDGTYRFSVSYGSYFTVQPIKEEQESNCETAITVYDAALTALHAVSMDTLTDCVYRAADVNEDGEVSIYDAALIAHHAVGLVGGSDSRVGQWRFSPDYRNLSWNELPKEDQNFQSVLLGEVSGNWAAEGSPDVLAKNEARYRCEVDGERVAICFPVVKGQLAAEIELSFDPADLGFDVVERGDAGRRFNIVVNDESDQIVKIGAYGSAPAASDGDLCRVYFTVRDRYKESLQLVVEKFMIDERDQGSARLNLYVADEEGVDKPAAFSVVNYPNPFNPRTVIEYHLNEAAEVDVSIYNLMGARVRTIYSGFETAGVYRRVWDGIDDHGLETGSGVYVCVVKGVRFTVRQKMVKLK